MSEQIIVTNPATGDVIATIPADNADSVNAKLKAGHEAFKTFSKTILGKFTR